MIKITTAKICVKFFGLFVLSVVLIPSVSGDLEPVLQRCCLSGESWARNHSSCTGPSDMANLQASDRSTCLTALYICCIRTHRNIHCLSGKNAAKQGKSCLALPAEGGEAYKDCCDGCSLGIQAEKMKMPCTFSRFTFGKPWDQAFQECCENPYSALGTSPQVTVTSQCDRRNPCSQKCEEINNQIKCSCHTGYQLGRDLTSCEDVNECIIGGHTCNPATETCVNAIGGFQCVSKSNPLPRSQPCPPGFLFNQDKRVCDDINECMLSDICPPGQICTNTAGSYTCASPNSTIISQCQGGFRFSHATRRCIDIDECIEDEHECEKDTEICMNTHGGYSCIEKPRKSRNCPAGFKWDDAKNNCEDIDECAENTHTCDLNNQNCVNAIGSYRCVNIADCPHGYRWNPQRSKCDDINECTENSHDCDHRSQVCINTPGSYQCQTKSPQRVTNCGTGFTYNSRSDTCEDINECELLKPCLTEQTCENTFGSYRCVCHLGFTLDPITKQCRDINECQLGLYSCDSSQRCDNTHGSFRCVRLTSCGTGYTLNAATSHCEDDDECALGTHNCGTGFQCRNTGGSFRCDRVKCPAGQKLLSDGTCKVVVCENGMEHDDDGNCLDINECLRGNPCRSYQRCVNTVGSYRCQNLLTCEVGFELNEQGNHCIDIDECARNLADCDPQQMCRNRPGGYICECPRGYSSPPNNHKVCEDIDECTRFRGQICASNSECINTQGSYKCNCNAGFRATDNDKSCIDVDECAESANICQQTCNNIWGSYQCSCQLGYTLGPDERSCQDINECEVYGGIGNLCIGFCVNEPGSFKCSCPNGYRLSSDGRTCQDIDECREGNICNDDKAVCLNTRGGYKCNRIECPPNYVRDKDHRNRCKRVTRDCQTGGPDCLKEPLSYSYNYITFVSNMRLPLSGQVDLFTMRGPRFQSTTVQFALELVSARAPQGTTAASKEHFHLRRTSYNEAMIALMKTIPGPQEIELDLVMKMYHNGLYGGTAIAKLFIYVTEYSF